MDRAGLVLGSLSPGRLAAALREQARFEQFCAEQDLTPASEAIAMYLADLACQGATSGPAMRRRLALLDVLARANGHQPWSTDPDLRLFIRGLLKRSPLANPLGTGNPLYLESIHALVDAIDLPGPTQIRQAAIICLAHHSRLRVRELHALHWRDVQLRGGGIHLTIQPHRGTAVTHLFVHTTDGPTCPAAGLRRLRDAQRRAVGPIFGPHDIVIYQTLAVAGFTHGWTDRPPLDDDRVRAACERVLQPTTRQSRDRALVMLAFAAGLKTEEVVALRRSDLELQAQGLIVTVQGRRAPVGVRAAAEPKYCPVRAWDNWERVRAQHRGAADHPAAFLQILRDHRLLAKGMTRKSLNFALHRASVAAGLGHRWGFSGLRQGGIRTAARNAAPPHVIAAQAGLQTLKAVEVHQRREDLIASSVAGRLGL